MQQTQADPLLDALVNDFGGNYTFALDLLEQYRADRGSVETTWRDYFDRLTGAAAQPPAATQTVTISAQAVPAGAGAAPAQGTLVRQEPAAAAVAPRDKSKALAIPALLPGDIAQPIRGAALRIAENMEASLQVPTATS